MRRTPVFLLRIMAGYPRAAPKQSEVRISRSGKDTFLFFFRCGLQQRQSTTVPQDAHKLLGITNDLSAPLSNRSYFGFAARPKEVRNV